MALAACLAGAGLASPAQQPQRSFWSLVVNEVPRGNVIAVIDGDRLWLRVAELERAGLHGFAGRRDTFFGEPHVLLASLEPDVTASLDTTNVVINLTAAARFFDETYVALQRERPSNLTISHSRSAFLNYSATWDESAGTSGFGEAGIALFGNTSLSSGVTVYPDGVVARGLSTLVVDRPSARQRLQLGDFVTAAPPLGSGPTLGGVAFGRDYSIDPYYFRYPTPFVRGTTTAPADVEIFVNGALVRRLSIGPGPYRFDRLPLNSGLGDVRVVVRDRLGRQQEYGGPVYLATGVLRRGDQDYQYAAGLRRDDDDEVPVYGDPEGTFYHRAGLTNWLTAGVSGEGSGEVAAGGPTLAVKLGRLGEVDLQAWASRTKDGTRGAAYYGVYTFASPKLTLSATAQRFDDGFANLFADPGTSQLPEFYQANAGVPLFSVGSLNYAFEAKRSPAAEFGFEVPAQGPDETLVRSRSHSLGLAFRVFGNAQLSGTATYTEVRGEKIWSGFAGLSIVLGRQTTANLTYSNFPGAESTFASLERSLPIGPGYGYRVTASDIDGGTATGQFEVNTRRARLTLNYDASDGGDRQTGSATLAGGLIATGGGVFLTRELQSSAAVVEVQGLKSVRVLADNVPIGRTDRSGRLLIPELLPYLGNRISIEETDIPFEYSVPVLSQLVAPPFRGAAYVRFLTQRIQGREGQVRMATGAGDMIPAFGSIAVEVGGRAVESPLNSDGAFFLDLPDGRHTATVTFRGQTCRVTFDATVTQDLVQNLGVLRCVP